MKDEEIQQLKQQLKKEKQLNAEIKKRFVEVEYDCEEFNHEYCDINCNGKRKETVDLYQLISDGLNETLLKQKDEEIKQLAKRICELQSDSTKAKIQIEKMKYCVNCQTWNEWQCPYARDKEKNYIYPNKNNCPCDKWKIKVVE